MLLSISLSLLRVSLTSWSAILAGANTLNTGSGNHIQCVILVEVSDSSRGMHWLLVCAWETGSAAVTEQVEALVIVTS